MKFVFDHYALQYMLEQFPRNNTKEFWTQFLIACQDGTITAHKETLKLLEQEVIEPDSLKWCKENASLFKVTTEAEAVLLGKWMEQGKFSFLETPFFVRSRIPEDIPFMLCMAKNATVAMYIGNTQTCILLALCGQNRRRNEPGY